MAATVLARLKTSRRPQATRRRRTRHRLYGTQWPAPTVHHMHKADGTEGNRNVSPISTLTGSSTLLDNSQDSLTSDGDIPPGAAIEGLGRQLKSEGDPVQRLRLLKAVMDASNAALDCAVTEARRAGETWQMVADALGTTRQAAHARWSKGERDERDNQGASQTLPAPRVQPTSTTRSRSWRWRIGGITLRGSASITVKPGRHR